MLVKALGGRRTELVCEECGYGIVVTSVPAACPMCHAARWELPVWRVFPGLREETQSPDSG
jgi:hypothetical protein